MTAVTAGGNKDAATPVVAIVEDQQAIAELLHEVLAGAGFHPVSVGFGHDAAEAVRRVGPAVILLDVMLPERSGWQILEDLRADPATHDVPVLVISAVYDRPGLHPLPPGGPVRFAGKPFDLAALLETVAALINESSVERRASRDS